MKKAEQIVLNIKEKAKEKLIEEEYIETAIIYFMEIYFNKIIELAVFLQYITLIYILGMEYQHIAKECGLDKAQFYNIKNGKIIPSLQKLRECNERLKKL